MIRYMIYARFADKPRMKFGSLFKDKRIYKSEKSAKSSISKIKEYRPELEFKVVPVEVHQCPECGTRLID